MAAAGARLKAPVAQAGIGAAGTRFGDDARRKRQPWCRRRVANAGKAIDTKLVGLS